MGLLKESDIELAILKYLNTKGFFWKVEHPGYMVKGNYYKNSHPYILAGMPDISGLYKGRPYYLEVKRPVEHRRIVNNWDKYLAYAGKDKTIKRYQRQINMVLKLRECGAVADFVSSMADCRALL